jgi:hypothetical protein
MRYAAVLTIAFALVAALQAQLRREDPRLTKAAAEAGSISEVLSGKLKSMLGKELASGSFANAVKVCSETALATTKDFSRFRGRYVRRVTLKPRNPNNVPDGFERRVLHTFAQVNRAGGVLRDYTKVVQGDSGPELRFLRPLTAGGVCLSCHGQADNIPAEVLRILEERYPDDKATGYRGGEVRGAISVRIPLAEGAD